MGSEMCIRDRIYLNSPANVSEDGLRTEILFPIDAETSAASTEETV